MSNVTWSIETYAAHNEALRSAEKELQTERDRRYFEVKEAEKEALRLKDDADKSALQLAREIQSYKDEKANQLRSQIEQERGTYAQKTDLISAVEKLEVALKPLLAFSISQQGRTAGISAAWGVMIAVVGVLGGGGLVGIFLMLLKK